MWPQSHSSQTLVPSLRASQSPEVCFLLNLLCRWGKPRQGNPSLQGLTPCKWQTQGINSGGTCKPGARALCLLTTLLLPSPRSPPRHVPGGLRHRLGAAAAAGAELLRAPGLALGAAAPAGLRALAGQAAALRAAGPGRPAAAVAGAQPGEAPAVGGPGPRVAPTSSPKSSTYHPPFCASTWTSGPGGPGLQLPRPP